MTKYHILIEESDESKTGAASGTQAISAEPFPIYAPTLEIGSRCRSLPIDLNSRGVFHLEAGCILTDVLSFSFNPCKNLLLSDRVAKLLHGFRISDPTFLPVDLAANGRSNPYQMLLIRSDLTPLIDFGSTRFHSVHTFSKKQAELHLSSMDDYQKWRQANDSLVRIVPSNGYTFTDDIGGYDLLRIGHFDVNLYVSDKLKRSLEEIGTSGIKFLETTRLV